LRVCFWIPGSRASPAPRNDVSLLLPRQEIEIAAVLGLCHALAVEPLIAPCRERRRLPLRAALGQLCVIDFEIEPAPFGIELDPVTVAHERERAPGRSLRRYMQ